LAREFGLKTVAEGVETLAEHNAILELGCDIGQGYHYSMPTEADALEAMLARNDVLPLT
jgi:EAL domain-containing protein (putative c-di-GMP-specific phosphodiesterase class I)